MCDQHAPWSLTELMWFVEEFRDGSLMQRVEDRAIEIASQLHLDGPNLWSCNGGCRNSDISYFF